MASTGDDSRHRVAFDLMEKVQRHEKPFDTNRKPTAEEAREYLLTLYGHCLQVVQGDKPSSVLEQFKKP